MATVIDALVVTLGLDPSKFTQGQKEAIDAFKKTEGEATRTAKEMEARGKQAAEFFSKIRDQVVTLAATFLGASGFKEFTEKITASDAAVGRLSENIGISTERLSAWEGVAAQFGSSAQDIDAAFRNTAKITAEYQQLGTSSATQAFARMNVDIGVFADKSTTAEQRTRMLQSALSKMSQQDAQFWGQRAGYSEKTINFLRETAPHIDEILEKQVKLNSVNAEDVRLAKLREEKWTELLQQAESLGRKILQDLTPALLTFGHAVEHIIEFLSEHKTETEAFLLTITAAFTLMSVVTFAKTIASIFGIKAALSGAAGEGVSLLGVFGRISAAFGAGAIGYALGWLMNKGIDIATGGIGAGSTLYDKINNDAKADAEVNLRTKPITRSGAPSSSPGSPISTASVVGGPAGDQHQRNIQMIQQELARPGLSEKARAILRQELAEEQAMIGQGNVDTSLARNTGKIVASNRSGATSNHTDVRIGEINVIAPKATDAPGIAKEIGPSVRNFTFGSQANTGLD